MLGGTYFYHCTETSTKQKQVFRYRYLRNENHTQGQDEYPVFLMINANSICVYKNSFLPPTPKVDESYHLSLLFSIPLYPKGSKLDKLSEAIINLCKEKGLNIDPCIKNNELLEMKNPYMIHDDKNEKVHEKKKLEYWVIFQHFLYDLSFSDVFQNAAHHDEAILHLRENYFVNCIIAKAENKYWEAAYGDKSNQKKRQYICDRYWEADKAWVNLIVEEKNNEILEVSENWFKGAEKEMNKVLRSENRIKLLNTVTSPNRIKEIKIQRGHIYHFFLQRFNTVSIEYYLLKHNTFTYILSISFLVISIFLFLDHLRTQPNSWVYLALLMVMIGLVQGVFRPLLFVFSNFLSQILFRISSRKHINYYNHSLGYPRMSLAIMAIWLGFIPVCEEAWQINLTLSDSAFKFYTIAFVLANLTAIFYFVNDVQYGNTTVRAIYKSLALFTKGMFISMAVGVFAMEVSRENIFSDPIEFLPKEVGIVKIDALTTTIDSLEKSITVRSQKTDRILADSIMIESLSKLKDTLIYKLAKQHVKNKKNWKMPSIAVFKLRKINYCFYIFPKLLFTYATFAFFIGLFVQVAFQGSSYRENL